MTTWINVIKAADFAEGSQQVVETDNVSVLIYNLNGEFFAIENVCTHDGGVLAGGCVEGDEIICPRHGAGFCLRTGAVTRAPAYEDIKTFPLRVEDGMLQVAVD
jgi:3-phenylpropionate/trans-cinnamate dioxygenase ferredoxin subunit